MAKKLVDWIIVVFELALAVLLLIAICNEVVAVPAAVLAAAVAAAFEATDVFTVTRPIILEVALLWFATMAAVNEVRLVIGTLATAAALEAIEAALALAIEATVPILLMFFEIPPMLELTTICNELMLAAPVFPAATAALAFAIAVLAAAVFAAT